MRGFLEAHVLLLPPEAGGRPRPIAPREGNYRPRLARDGEDLSVCFIEGPPLLEPGHGARIIAEIDPSRNCCDVAAGDELQIIEGSSIVGILTVLRVV